MILAEHSGQLGGMGTLGNVSIFMGVGNVTGIYRELIGEMLPDQLPASQTESVWPQYNPFRFRHYLNEKLSKEGVEVLFHASFVGAIQVGGRVTGIVVGTREGLLARKARPLSIVPETDALRSMRERPSRPGGNPMVLHSR